MAEDLLRTYTEAEDNHSYPISFVPGRLITDNVLLAFESNHFLNTYSKGQKHFMNLKLDISKAYDRVEWSFTRRVLVPNLVLSFPRGDSVTGTLHPLICFYFVQSDLVRFFGRSLIGDQSWGWRFILVLPASPIYSWSTTPCRNTPLNTQRSLAEVLGLRLENKHEGWHEKSLSQAGKAVLIQAMVQAIPPYAMSCFKLPKTLLQEFQALAANYFWHNGDRWRIHWLAWDQMCRNKLESGLGCRNVKAFNLALLAKQLWVVEFTRNYLVALTAHGEALTKETSAPLENQVRWIHPPPDSIKINFNGGFLMVGEPWVLGFLPAMSPITA
ncbi:UNVERIFIED_CONTAM: hypothetical protein Slati_0211200 [Sesamum latifolium]|uniref:Reverse transcriptase domain-containing protein n=1 Tax=Sesamum latifolium TaxID=2727402 RepID=A0AAW2YC39_9LAMI